MENNIDLILVMVLVTLLSVAVISIITYLVVVVRKLKVVVNEQKNEIQSIFSVIDNIYTEFNKKEEILARAKNEIYDEIYRRNDDMDKKIDTRSDKLHDMIMKKISSLIGKE